MESMFKSLRIVEPEAPKKRLRLDIDLNVPYSEPDKEPILTPSITSHESIVLPPKFVRIAFPSRLEYVRVIQRGRFCYNMCLRWTAKKQYYQVVMYRDWSALVRNNILRHGNKVRFTVYSNNDVMYAEVE
ncbi:hypothetical protein PIB30_083244 [Stylosanthes scabra]|uniref:TF-B3 domain-containing protein n=1 Tax=Stylosanthes scabra TaxID=79078 RepID=A0ABU6XQM5_9FABA|nr:hypothetical protein [Stylosanthes scabra]